MFDLGRLHHDLMLARLLNATAWARALRRTADGGAPWRLIFRGGHDVEGGDL